MFKVAIIGTESTGKSTLCAQLAKHYNTLWVQEYARAYLSSRATDYTYDDLLHIAKAQVEEEEKTMLQAAANKIIFIDTELYVIKIWSEFVFNNCHRFILDELAQRKYDLYLLMNNELPWVKDELREYADINLRHQLFHHFKQILIGESIPWALISGYGEERLRNSVSVISSVLKV